MQENQNPDFFKSKVLGHPSGLFVLFFTEMWERFSYYGMRALLVLFLISAFGLGGWEWPRAHALSLYGTYTALVYITPIIGGYIADKIIGYRKAVIIGALIMTLGHASMAIESNHIFLYIGIGLLIVGNGFFKPNMTSIISHMYKDVPEKKDGAYTIFYMGVNAGAFLGILLCGYLGEKVGWGYGFGLAGIFMLLGMLQFYFTQSIFGNIGIKPEPSTPESEAAQLEFKEDKLNPFNKMDIFLTAFSAILAVVWVINDPLSKIAGINVLEFAERDFSNYIILIALAAFLILIVSRLARYPKITKDRMIAIIIFAVMTVIFWMCFEQAGGSMNIFAQDYTDRIMTGNYYFVFLVVDVIITVVPVGIITWVLFKLFQQTFANYRLANLILASSFVFIWGIIFWKFYRDFNSTSYVADYDVVQTYVTPDEYNLHPDRADAVKSMFLGGDAFLNDEEENILLDSVVYNGQTFKHEQSDIWKRSDREAEQAAFDAAFIDPIMAIENTDEAIIYYHEREDVKTIPMSDLYFETIIKAETEVAATERVVSKNTTVIEPVKMKVGDELSLIGLSGKLNYLTPEKVERVETEAAAKGSKTGLIFGEVSEIKKNEVEIPATWFLILNSLFIIMFAPLFSKWWESKYNPSASAKYGLGLILLGIGFGALAFGSMGIEAGAKTASVSLIWLVFAYLFHTLGELCLSPVALSYVSKLVPGRMIAMMFGIWYIAVAIGNKLAGLLGGQIDKITENYDMTTFFLIFTGVPILFGIIAILLSPIVKKLMHGVR